MKPLDMLMKIIAHAELTATNMVRAHDREPLQEHYRKLRVDIDNMMTAGKRAEARLQEIAGRVLALQETADKTKDGLLRVDARMFAQLVTLLNAPPDAESEPAIEKCEPQEQEPIE